MYVHDASWLAGTVCVCVCVSGHAERGVRAPAGRVVDLLLELYDGGVRHFLLHLINSDTTSYNVHLYNIHNTHSTCQSIHGLV